MKLLKSLSLLSLPILTVSFAHASENDWGQWEDDSFNIESIENTNIDLRNSVNSYLSKNKSKKAHNINNKSYNKNDFEALSDAETLRINQEHDEIQYVDKDISDYENKGNASIDSNILDRPLEIEISELHNNIELPEFEPEYNRPAPEDYEDSKFREDIEPPEFDYQDYEYKIEVPAEPETQE